MNKPKDPVIFEKALEALNQAVQKLESGSLPLDEALKTFEQGVKIGNDCQNLLQSAEQQVNLLMESSQTLEPFSTDISNDDPTEE